MYIKELTVKDIDEIAKLEEQVYPEYMCLGKEDYLEDFNDCSTNYSYGVYKDGILVSYIIAYRNDEEYYISDLVCTNKMTLLPLFMKFSNVLFVDEWKAEMRKESYSLLKNFVRKYPNWISILKEEIMEEYYYGEDAYNVTFKINDMPKGNIKLEIIKMVYDSYGPVNVKLVMYDLHRVLGYSLEEIEKQKKFILKHVNEKNLQPYHLIGDEFRLLITHTLPLKRDKHNPYLEGMQKKGKEQIDSGLSHRLLDSCHFDMPLENKFSYYSYDSNVSWWRYQVLDNTKYRTKSAGYYRWKIGRDVIRYFRNKKNVVSVAILDKKGHILFEVSPKNDNMYNLLPRNYRNVFDYYLKNLSFIDNVEVHPNYVDKNKYIYQFYIQMVEHLIKDHQLDFAVQGASYNDLFLFEDRNFEYMREFEPLEINNKKFYTDADRVALLPFGSQLSNEEIKSTLRNQLSSVRNKQNNEFAYA